MAIVKKPVIKTADAFIGAAPDAAAPAPSVRRGVRKGNKLQITLTISEQLLARVDDRAAQLGQSRAGVINLAIFQALESGLRIEGVE